MTELMKRTTRTTSALDCLLTRVEASHHLQARWGIGLSAGTLANMAVSNTGPLFHREHGRARYAVGDLDAWAQQRLAPLLNTLRTCLQINRQTGGTSDGFDQQE